MWQEIDGERLSCHSWQETDGRRITAMSTLTAVLALLVIVTALAGLVRYAAHDVFATRRTQVRDEFGRTPTARLVN